MIEHFFTFLLAASLFYSLPTYASDIEQKNQTYPTGIASIKLGDSKRTVYRKIMTSDYIKTQSVSYQDWLSNLDKKNDMVSLFSKKFKVRWSFSKRDKLYLIRLSIFISKEIFQNSEKDSVNKINRLMVEQYSYKYGEPITLNLDAYPGHDIEDFSAEVAEWKFPNNISVDMKIELDLIKLTRGERLIYFILDIFDNQELQKVRDDYQREKALEKKKERDRRIRKYKKSRDLL